MQQHEKECLDFFHQNLVWDKVWKGFREKYRSYGRFAGTVKLKDLDREAVEALEGFFGKSYHGQSTVSISAAQMQKAWSRSRFQDVTPERILELYYGEKPIGKRQQKEEKARRQGEILGKIAQKYEATPAQEQLTFLASVIRCDTEEAFAQWEASLCLGADMMNALPYRQGKQMYLAVFAAAVTGDPHAFDAGSAGGRLLDLIVQHDLKSRGLKIAASAQFPSYHRRRSYLEAGILVDDVSNYVSLFGVRACDARGRMHEGMDGFWWERDIVQVPLGALAGWHALVCPQQTVYIVENPSVFAMLCENKPREKSYMCMNGQPRLAGLLALERLAASDTKVYYAGDFDPEGLLIAQKLAAFYPGDFRYWHMTPEDYRQCESEREISGRRLKMLDKITDSALRPVARELMIRGVAGYQERIFLNLLSYKNFQ